MFILKYKHDDDIFYRVTSTRQPSKKSILFEAPSAPPVSAKRVSNALAMLEKTFREEEKEEKDTKKEKKANKMASSVILNFLKAE